jgi:epsilon-lactone hydrolase
VVAAYVGMVRRYSPVVDEDRTRREVLDKQAATGTAPPRRVVRGLHVSTLDAAPFATWDVRVAGTTPDRTVLYLHGGGYTSDIDPWHWRYVAKLARGLGVRVVLPSYPLAPTHTWRDALPSLADLFDRLAVESPAGVGIMGDSAGGGLALSVAQRIAGGPGPQPIRLVLISPWVELSGETPGTELAAAADPWLSLTKLRLYGRWWAGGEDVRRPEGSPLYGNLAGLPPALVYCGTRDILCPQVRELDERARIAGAEWTYVEGPGLIHVYPLLPIPEAKQAWRELVAFW